MTKQNTLFFHSNLQLFPAHSIVWLTTNTKQLKSLFVSGGKEEFYLAPGLRHIFLGVKEELKGS